MRKYVTRGDIILVIVLTIVSITSIGFTRILAQGGKRAIVEVDGKRVLELPLNRNVSTSVTGPLGETFIEIRDGSVGIIESPCPNDYCVHMSPIRYSGELVVCVPNRVVISIKNGGGGESLDGVTQ